MPPRDGERRRRDRISSTFGVEKIAAKSIRYPRACASLIKDLFAVEMKFHGSVFGSYTARIGRSVDDRYPVE